MKEHPILFSAPMIQAILAGRKTQTRRVVKAGKAQSWATPDFFKNVKSVRMYDGFLALEHPGGGPGGCIRVPFRASDRLWVRETWASTEQTGANKGDSEIVYRADGQPWAEEFDGWKWKPSIFIPRWASRITLEVVGVRAERLQDISEADATAEGLQGITKDGTLVKYGIPDRDGLHGTDDLGWPWHDWNADPRKAYRTLWERINGEGSWAANPLVWVVEFKKLEGGGLSHV